MNYANLFAKYYDVFYAGKKYDVEARFINDFFDQQNSTVQRIIEFACGSGKHALELGKLGFQVDGFDLSQEMVDRASHRNSGNPMLRFQQGNMQNCGGGNAQYDAGIVLFDSLGYVQTNEAISETLRNMFNNLKPGGLFVGEVWHGSAFIKHFEPVREREWELGNVNLTRTSRTEIDLHRQLGMVSYEIVETQNGEIATYVETHKNRYFFAQEIAHFVTSAGFEVMGLYPGFSFERNTVGEQDFHIVFTAKKPE